MRSAGHDVAARIPATSAVGVLRYARFMSKHVNLAVIPGDGIGPEVTAEALKVLAAAVGDDATVSTTEYPFGAGHYLATGSILDDADLESLRAHDGILLGAVGGDPRDPRLAGGIIERGLLLKLRFAFDHYVNLRPTVLYPTRAVAARVAWRRRLRGGAGRHGGTVRGQRRQHPRGHPARDRQRGEREHRVRGRAARALRLRAGDDPAQPAHPRAQDERARARRVAVAAHRRRGRGRVSGRRPSTTCTWTRPPSSLSPTRRAST